MKSPEFYLKRYKTTFCLSERFLNKALFHPEATEEFVFNCLQKLGRFHFQKIGLKRLAKLEMNAAKLRLLLIPTCGEIAEPVYEYTLEHPDTDGHVLYKIACRGPVYLLGKVSTHEKTTEEIKKIAEERMEKAKELAELFEKMADNFDFAFQVTNPNF